MKLKVDIEAQINDVKKCKSIAKKNNDESNEMMYQGILMGLQWMLQKREDGCFDTGWLDANALKESYLKEN